MPLSTIALNPLHFASTKSSPPPQPRAAAPANSAVASLAVRCRDGSAPAFEELVGQFEARIYGFLVRHTGNAHDAEDLTQETFVRAWRGIARFDPTRDFAAWLFTIARRVAANHFRARRTHDPLPVELASPNAEPGDAASTGDSSSALWRAARKLKPSQYEALWLRYAEGFSVAETARVMGLTSIHVKVILHRARKELARHFKPENL